MGKVRKERKEARGGREEEEEQREVEKESKDTDLFEQLFGDGDKESETATKKRKQRRPRPKVNYELLASADGLPLLCKKLQTIKIDPEEPYESLLKIRRLMEEWQTHLIPSFNYDDFLDKTEGLSGNRPVKVNNQYPFLRSLILPLKLLETG